MDALDSTGPSHPHEPSRQSLLVLALGFAAVRASARLAGVAFDYDTVETHWQFLDRHLLEDRLAESLYALHAQPPGLNLLYGLFAKLSPNDHGAALAGLLFFGLGLAATLALFALLRRLGVGRALAWVAVAIFVLDPAAILFESYFFYTHLVMALLVLAASALERWLATGRTAYVVGLFASLAAVALTRSSFHVVWLVATVALVAALGRERRRAAVICGLAAIALVGAWYGKNAVRFGHFTTSTWAGMNVTRYVSNRVPDQQIAAYVRDGVVSRLYWLSPFASVEEYSEIVALPPTTGVAALDAPRKSGGATNYNNLVYVGVSERYLSDSLRLVTARPDLLVASQPDTWTLYFQPSTQYFDFIGAVFARSGAHAANADRLAPYSRVWNALVGLDLAAPPPREALLGYHRPEAFWPKLATISWSSLLGSLVVFFVAPLHAWRRLRGSADDRRAALVLLFMWLAVVWVALVGNSVEVGENQRFKFETHALWIALLAATLTDWWRNRRASRG